MSYNPECPEDFAFPNMVEVVSRDTRPDGPSVVLWPTVRANINARNCTVMFRAAESAPTRADVLAQAAQEGATRAAADYVGVFVEPMDGGGYMASIEQLDYTYPVSEHDFRIMGGGDVASLTDAQIIAQARAAGVLAGEFSP